MTRHLILASGYELTECRLTELARGDDLTNFAARMTCPDCRRALIGRGVCPACEGGPIVWSAGPVKLNTVVDGRLTMRDVETQFYLGCEECSETLINSISPDEVAKFLTSEGWRP